MVAKPCQADFASLTIVEGFLTSLSRFGTSAAKAKALPFRSWLASAVLEVRTMDPGLFVVLVGFGPLVMLAFLVRTRFAWVPGTLLMVGACVTFGMIQPVHDDIGGMGAFANGVLTLIALGVFFYGLLLLITGCVLSPKSERRQSTTLPVATVVSGVSTTAER